VVGGHVPGTVQHEILSKALYRLESVKYSKAEVKLFWFDAVSEGLVEWFRNQLQ